ncbi:hypothetical protein BSLG_003112 [Batrachochytrium salamandrivorans]|nr:hypothetical protein BSLG_003112 [Batrachochytrium salamandrivorans]
MMLHLRGHIDEFIPKCIEVAYGTLMPSIEATQLSHEAGPTSNGAPTPLKRFLNELNGFLALDMWFKNLEHFTRVHDKRLAILTLAQLVDLACCDTACPPTLKATWPHFFKAFKVAGRRRVGGGGVSHNGGGDAESDDEEAERMRTTTGADGMMLEDVYFTTYLDKVNVFEQFEVLMGTIMRTDSLRF